MKVWTLSLAGLSVAAALVLAACSDSHAKAAAAAPAAPEVSVAEVVARDVTQWDEFTGRVEAVESVDVRPRVSGYIDQVNFAEGKEVRKGDVLFVIDQRPYRADLASAEAVLARARSEAELTRSQVARAEKLLESHAISKEEYDQRVAASTQATASVRAAEAAVTTSKLNLEWTEVRSPIDGRAGRALITAGNLVTTQPASLLTTVVSLDPVYVYFQGDEQTYLRYNQMARDGSRPSSRDARNPVQVGLSNESGFPHQGYVDFVDNQVDAATGTIRARAVLDNKDRIFTPGLFARVKLLGSSKYSALLIDEKAVLTDQDRKYVYVLGADDKAERRDVKLGRASDGLVVVADGLKPGDRVIVNGVQKVFFPGMQVKPQVVAMDKTTAAPSLQTASIRSEP
ncbi:MAG TPA: efflux RND transporter periplasmic adaptor subunit [Nevskiaceae bacterium]|nr:efflux RND transporter periplasmic adaptor subunit [Nevskiaceae bacterium]